MDSVALRLAVLRRRRLPALYSLLTEAAGRCTANETEDASDHGDRPEFRRYRHTWWLAVSGTPVYHSLLAHIFLFGRVLEGVVFLTRMHIPMIPFYCY